MSLKSMAAQHLIKKTDKYRVPYHMIEVMPRFNARVDSPANADHVAAIYQTLKLQLTTPGVLDADKQMEKGLHLLAHDFMINVDYSDNLTLIDGHMTSRAIARLIKDGIVTKDFLIDVDWRRGTLAECRKLMILAGQAKELEPLELGLAFRDTRDQDKKSLQSIADELGRSIVNIRDNLLLGDAPEALQAIIIAGKVSGSEALAAIKKYGDGALEYLRMGIEEAEAQGKTAFTAVIAEGRALPKKIVKSLVTATESLFDNTVRLQLAQLEHLPVEQLETKTVQVSAKMMMELLQAQLSIEEQNKKAAEKRDRAISQASQRDLVAEGENAIHG